VYGFLFPPHRRSGGYAVNITMIYSLA